MQARQDAVEALARASTKPGRESYVAEWVSVLLGLALIVCSTLGILWMFRYPPFETEERVPGFGPASGNDALAQVIVDCPFPVKVGAFWVVRDGVSLGLHFDKPVANKFGMPIDLGRKMAQCKYVDITVWTYKPVLLPVPSEGFDGVPHAALAPWAEYATPEVTPGRYYILLKGPALQRAASGRLDFVFNISLGQLGRATSVTERELNLSVWSGAASGNAMVEMKVSMDGSQDVKSIVPEPASRSGPYPQTDFTVKPYGGQSDRRFASARVTYVEKSLQSRENLLNLSLPALWALGAASLLQGLVSGLAKRFKS